MFSKTKPIHLLYKIANMCEIIRTKFKNLFKYYLNFEFKSNYDNSNKICKYQIKFWQLQECYFNSYFIISKMWILSSTISS
jgi:hypothetical protein